MVTFSNIHMFFLQLCGGHPESLLTNGGTGPKKDTHEKIADYAHAVASLEPYEGKIKKT